MAFTLQLEWYGTYIYVSKEDSNFFISESKNLFQSFGCTSSEN